VNELSDLVPTLRAELAQALLMLTCQALDLDTVLPGELVKASVMLAFEQIDFVPMRDL
jgi:hypothetical protein